MSLMLCPRESDESFLLNWFKLVFFLGKYLFSVNIIFIGNYMPTHWQNWDENGRVKVDHLTRDGEVIARFSTRHTKATVTWCVSPKSQRRNQTSFWTRFETWNEIMATKRCQNKHRGPKMGLGTFGWRCLYNLQYINHQEPLVIYRPSLAMLLYSRNFI